jgi:hypothetical protein
MPRVLDPAAASKKRYDARNALDETMDLDVDSRGSAPPSFAAAPPPLTPAQKPPMGGAGTPPVISLQSGMGDRIAHERMHPESGLEPSERPVKDRLVRMPQPALAERVPVTPTAQPQPQPQPQPQSQPQSQPQPPPPPPPPPSQPIQVGIHPPIAVAQHASPVHPTSLHSTPSQPAPVQKPKVQPIQHVRPEVASQRPLQQQPPARPEVPPHHRMDRSEPHMKDILQGPRPSPPRAVQTSQPTAYEPVARPLVRPVGQQQPPPQQGFAQPQISPPSQYVPPQGPVSRSAPPIPIHTPPPGEIRGRPPHQMMPPSSPHPISSQAPPHPPPLLLGHYSAPRAQLVSGAPQPPLQSPTVQQLAQQPALNPSTSVVPARSRGMEVNALLNPTEELRPPTRPQSRASAPARQPPPPELQRPTRQIASPPSIPPRGPSTPQPQGMYAPREDPVRSYSYDPARHGQTPVQLPSVGAGTMFPPPGPQYPPPQHYHQQYSSAPPPPYSMGDYAYSHPQPGPRDYSVQQQRPMGQPQMGGYTQQPQPQQPAPQPQNGPYGTRTPAWNEAPQPYKWN